jgi:TRAP-type uncharacterized transport system fused permease subunit
MHGNPLTIAWAVITAAIGIWLGTVGVVGYFYRVIPAVERILFVVAGVLTLIPSDMFARAYFTDIVGLALGGVLIVRELGLKKPRPA